MYQSTISKMFYITGPNRQLPKNPSNLGSEWNANNNSIIDTYMTGYKLKSSKHYVKHVMLHDQ